VPETLGIPSPALANALCRCRELGDFHVGSQSRSADSGEVPN
jgi:hypothetical protein